MESQFSKPRRVRVNPSRTTCEEIIRRILNAEIKENGHNRHFKNAMDFMSYFESLYPPGSALTKQVQRAIKSLDLAKDENGYFLIDVTKAQAAADNELAKILKKTGAAVSEQTTFSCVFLSADSMHRSYLLELIASSEKLHDLYVTVMDSSDGLIFLTDDPSLLSQELQRLLRLPG